MRGLTIIAFVLINVALGPAEAAGGRLLRQEAAISEQAAEMSTADSTAAAAAPLALVELIIKLVPRAMAAAPAASAGSGGGGGGGSAPAAAAAGASTTKAAESPCAQSIWLSYFIGTFCAVPGQCSGARLLLAQLRPCRLRFTPSRRSHQPAQGGRQGRGDIHGWAVGGRLMTQPAT
jgi:hypothetical protein